VQTTGDLERWFAGDAAIPARSEAFDSSHTPSLLCLRSTVEPLVVYYLPVQSWLLICSLAVLVLGMALYLLARREGKSTLQSPQLWLALAVLALALAATGVLWPTLATAIMHGAQPGIVVLLVVSVVLWLLHERQRRQLVFLPSFSRGHKDSSVVRNSPSSAHRGKPHGEPSTVDEPRPVAG
jgi:hypothetical protein